MMICKHCETPYHPTESCGCSYSQVEELETKLAIATEALEFYAENPAGGRYENTRAAKALAKIEGGRPDTSTPNLSRLFELRDAKNNGDTDWKAVRQEIDRLQALTEKVTSEPSGDECKGLYDKACGECSHCVAHLAEAKESMDRLAAQSNDCEECFFNGRHYDKNALCSKHASKVQTAKGRDLIEHERCDWSKCPWCSARTGSGRAE